MGLELDKASVDVIEYSVRFLWRSGIKLGFYLVIWLWLAQFIYEILYVFLSGIFLLTFFITGGLVDPAFTP